MIPTVSSLWFNYKQGLLSPDDTELLCEKLREIHTFLSVKPTPTLSEITSTISEIETQRWKETNPF